MFWIDLGFLLILAYSVVVLLNVIRSIWERLALALALALGLKSVEIFALILIGVRPEIHLQAILSGAALGVFAVFMRRKIRLPARSPADTEPTGFTPQGVAALLVLGILFAFSVGNTLFFPITETDGIWYHVKAMLYYRQGELTSDFNHPQHRFYSPFVPLLYTYLISVGSEKLKIIFPLFYLCLLVVFYHRILEASANARLSAVFTLILGTTPYLWWHSVHSLLNLAAGVYFSLGTLFWFFLVRNLLDGKDRQPASRSLALMSGFFFGIAGWARLEFILYVAVPLLVLIFVLDRQAAASRDQNFKTLLSFAVPALIPSSAWFATLAAMISLDATIVLGLMAFCLLLWMMILAFRFGRTRWSDRTILVSAIAAAAAYLLLLHTLGPAKLSTASALGIGVYRSLAFHGFYAFTVFLILFLFAGRPGPFSGAEKYLGTFLILYLILHFALYAYFHPEWSSFREYWEATWIRPGTGVNTADTRELLAFYPALIFFIALLPKVKEIFR